MHAIVIARGRLFHSKIQFRTFPIRYSVKYIVFFLNLTKHFPLTTFNHRKQNILLPYRIPNMNGERIMFFTKIHHFLLFAYPHLSRRPLLFVLLGSAIATTNVPFAGKVKIATPTGKRTVIIFPKLKTTRFSTIWLWT